MRNPTLTRRLATLQALLPTVLLSIVLSLLGLVVVRRLVPIEALRESREVVGNYLQTIGTIYAVLLAFVVFVVWQQFNDARGHAETEANELLDLIRTAKGFPASVRARLHQLAADYLRVVLDREWTAMARDDDAELVEGNALIDRMWDVLVAYEPCSECHKSLYNEALARFNDLSDSRTNRISSSRLHIPLALRVLLRTGALMTVCSMYLFPVERLAIHALITGALAGAIGHVLYIIADLDNCFDGDWIVPTAPFERVQRYLNALSPVAPAAAVVAGG